MARQGLFAIILMVLAAPAEANSAPVPRKDLTTSFGSVACKTSGPTGPGAAWSAGFFDAQIEGRHLVPLKGRKADPGDAVRKAKAIARVLHYGGYAGALCPDGKAWAVATPAPEPLVVTGKTSKGVRLPLAALAKRCETWRADFASAAKGQPQRLAVSAAGRVELSKEMQSQGGVLSVTCKPKKPRWLGPQQWYLVPIGGGPSAEVPGGEAFASRLEPAVELQNWINAVRAAERLPAVKFVSELHHEADLLAIGGSLAHNRMLLERAAKSLKTGKIRLLGENRARAADAKSLAWLLWTSPRHRELILDREATLAGLKLTQKKDGLFVVLTMGANERLKTAAKD